MISQNANSEAYKMKTSSFIWPSMLTVSLLKKVDNSGCGIVARGMSRRENLLRVIEFRYPEWIPCNVIILPATWHKYRERLGGILLRHPRLFPDFKKGSVDFDDFGHMRKGNISTDARGCSGSS